MHILSIAIDIICNDMEIWSSKEQTYISTQWELIKEDIIKTEKAKTAKTYSKVFSEQFPNVVNPGFMYITATILLLFIILEKSIE